MKISRLQLIIIIIIVLLVIMIILSPRPQQKPNIISPKTEAPSETEQPSSMGKYELPPKQENPASVNTPGKKPSEAVTGIKPPVNPPAPTQEAPAPKEEADKFNKTPPPERLHEMQQKGILIY